VFLMAKNIERNIDLLKFFEDNKGPLAGLSLFFILAYYLYSNILPKLESLHDVDYGILRLLPLVSLGIFLIISICVIQKLINIGKKSMWMKLFTVFFILFILGLTSIFLRLYWDFTTTLFQLLTTLGIPIIAIYITLEYVNTKKHWLVDLILAIFLFLAWLDVFNVYRWIVDITKLKTSDPNVILLSTGVSTAAVLISGIATLILSSWTSDKIVSGLQKKWIKSFKRK